MHLAVLKFIYMTVAAYGKPHTIVDLGGQNTNGSPRFMFPPDCHYISVDMEAGDGVDVVADASLYVPPEPPDLVLCLEVLEHSPRAEGIVRNAIKMLKPGGLLVLTCAGPGRRPHGTKTVDLPVGEYYRNVEPGWVGQWMSDAFLGNVAHDADRGDIQAWAIKGGM